AAQTGFLDGPRTLAAMATDEWVPKRFKNLSERLVTQNGVLSMGLAAAAAPVYTRGAGELLVAMYSINVFLTFTPRQAGMARHRDRAGGVLRRTRRAHPALGPAGVSPPLPQLRVRERGPGGLGAVQGRGRAGGARGQGAERPRDLRGAGGAHGLLRGVPLRA